VSESTIQEPELCLRQFGPVFNAPVCWALYVMNKLIHLLILLTLSFPAFACKKEPVELKSFAKLVEVREDLNEHTFEIFAPKIRDSHYLSGFSFNYSGELSGSLRYSEGADEKDYYSAYIIIKPSKIESISFDFTYSQTLDKKAYSLCGNTYTYKLNELINNHALNIDIPKSVG
jgi:hypothetical protein